jgi:SAM-dependent methyltransferase
MPLPEPNLPRIDTSRPHPARVYDWLLGGKDNYPVDEELGRQVLAIDPTVRNSARVNRGFMRKATEMLAAEGIRQYLDIGTGIPTEPNLHQVAQAIAPESRVVYADNDPIVLRHAEALLRSTPEGVTSYIQADLRETGRIVERAENALDFGKPIALSLISLLHFIADEDDAYGLVRRLVDVLAPGSYLVFSHATADGSSREAAEVVELYRKGGVVLCPRSHADVARFFDGLSFVGPGLVRVSDWRVGPEAPEGSGDPVTVYAGVARKT